MERILNAGLWIDHREVVIVLLSKTGSATQRIHSGLNKHREWRGDGEEPRHSTKRIRFSAKSNSAAREIAYRKHLARYYDAIILRLQDAASVLIFGPGEAQGELKKQFEQHQHATHTFVMETRDRMTEAQIVAKVRHHFHFDAPSRVDPSSRRELASGENPLGCGLLIEDRFNRGIRRHAAPHIVKQPIGMHHDVGVRPSDHF